MSGVSAYGGKAQEIRCKISLHADCFRIIWASVKRTGRRGEQPGGGIPGYGARAAA